MEAVKKQEACGLVKHAFGSTYSPKKKVAKNCKM